MTLKNSLCVARVHSRIDPRKQDGLHVVSKDASIHKDYNRTNKGQTYCSYEERNYLARPRREELVVTHPPYVPHALLFMFRLLIPGCGLSPILSY